MFNINAEQLLLAKLLLHFQTALRKKNKMHIVFKSPSIFSSDLSLGKKICKVVRCTQEIILIVVLAIIYFFFLCLSADRAASITLSETLGELHQHSVKSAGDF